MAIDTTTPLRDRRLSRDQFLARALEVLSNEGESELRIDRLVRAIGVTKGSFYWHFKSRADFVRSLAEYWERWSTNKVVEEIGSTDQDPKQILIKIHQIVTRDDLVRYDLVMRSWALHEPYVAERVRSVDKTRFGFVRKQFRRLGYEGEDLQIRTRSYVVTSSLWTVMEQTASRKAQLRQLLGVLELLTGPAVR